MILSKGGFTYKDIQEMSINTREAFYDRLLKITKAMNKVDEKPSEE